MGANPSRERTHLNQEYIERSYANQSMATGNYQAAALHQNRADWQAYQADQVHYKRYQKGRTFAPYAVHAGTPFTQTIGGPVTAPTYSAMPYTNLGSGAVYPGYAGPTVYNPVGSRLETYPVTTQVPVGSQTYDLCMPTTTLAPVGAVAAPVFPQATAFPQAAAFPQVSAFPQAAALGSSAVYPSAGFF